MSLVGYVLDNILDDVIISYIIMTLQIFIKFKKLFTKNSSFYISDLKYYIIIKTNTTSYTIYKLLNFLILENFG